MKEINDITNQLKNKLPFETYKRINEYIKYNEWGVAFELLCEEIYEHSISITKKQFDDLCDICTKMQGSAEYCSDLKQFIEDIKHL